MTDKHQVDSKLRMLKLGGMIETLEMRLDQAQKDGVNFTQFLEVLLEDEVQHRANKRLASRLLADLGGGRADETWEKRLQHYLKPDLLILDDFAMKEFTKTQAEDIYELIDRRHRNTSLIVTANRAPKDWYPLFPNPVIAESVLDRLISGAHMITLTGKSYRSMLRPNKVLAGEVVTV
jgi:DNA replication protein DnaC